RCAAAYRQRPRDSQLNLYAGGRRHPPRRGGIRPRRPDQHTDACAPVHYRPAAARRNRHADHHRRQPNHHHGVTRCPRFPTWPRRRRSPASNSSPACKALPTPECRCWRSAPCRAATCCSGAGPGAGKLRWNNAAPASATVLYIDNAASDTTDISASWAMLAVGGFVYVQGSADGPHRANWQKWQITSVTTATGYAKLGVSLQASAGAFADTDAVEL